MIISFFYNILLALGSLYWIIITSAKWNVIKSKINPKIAEAKDKKEVILVYSVSIGELKSVIPLIKRIKKSHDCLIYLSTSTNTAYEHAQSCQYIDHVFYVPLDFSWNVHRMYKALRPKLLILVETSFFWFHLVTLAPLYGAAIVLVNGRISELSVKRLRLIPWYTKRLFANMDKICVQNDTYRDRFLRLGASEKKISVINNIKYDQEVEQLTEKQREHYKGIFKAEKIITIASTHHPEEEMILDQIQPLWEKHHFCCFLAPRHPERFNEVAELLKKRGIEFSLWSEQKDAPVVLIDSMGLLGICYSLSILAITGRSYVKPGGGHNIIEPNFFGTGVFFGPYMHKQLSLKQHVLDHSSGEVVPIEYMNIEISNILTNPERVEAMRQGAKNLVKNIKGGMKDTYEQIVGFIN